MKISKKGIMVLTTMLLIALAFLYYFFVYVANNEKALIANNMRVLANMKSNVENLVEGQLKVHLNHLRMSEKNPEIEKENFVTRYDEQGLVFKLKSDSTADGKSNKVKSAEKTPELSSDFLPYKEVFASPLVERKDIFDFVTISKITTTKEGSPGKSIYPKEFETLYTNDDTRGNLYFTQDSTIGLFQTKNIFELNFGASTYIAYSIMVCRSESSVLYLTGFINKNDFEDKKRELSAFVISFAAILTICLLLALPILKLFVMSNVERLNLKDVFFTGVSVTVIPTVIILLFMFMIAQFVDDKRTASDDLQQLSEQITRNFGQELANARRFAEAIRESSDQELSQENLSDEGWNKIQRFPRNPMNGLFTKLAKEGRAPVEYAKAKIDKDPVHYKSITNEILAKIIDKEVIQCFPYYHSIFWTTGSGEVKIHLTCEKESQPGVDLSHRKYVMDINNHRNLYQDKDLGCDTTFSFESIRSIVDGRYEMGLGIPTGLEELPVLAISFTSMAVMDPIMMPGFGFCIFDASGKTIFHSDKQRNLNEDFLEETSGVFRPYMTSHEAYMTSVDYMGRSQMVLVRPFSVNGTPYFIATFVNKQQLNAINSQAINVALELQLVFLGILLGLFGLFSLFNIKDNKLKQRVFIFSWLKPFCHPPKSFNRAYFSLAMVNFTGAGYCVMEWLMFEDYPDVVILDLMLMGVMLSGVGYHVLITKLPSSEKIGTYLNDPKRKEVVISGFFLVSGLLLISRLYLAPWKESFFWSLLSLIGIAGVGLLIAFVIDVLLYQSDQPQPSTSNNRYMALRKWYRKGVRSLSGSTTRRSYLTFCFSLIMLLSVVPTFIFYAISYDEERSLLQNYRLRHLVNNYQQWNQVKSNSFEKVDKLERSPLIENLPRYIEEIKWTNPSLIDLSGVGLDQNFDTLYAINQQVSQAKKAGASMLWSSYYPHIRIPINAFVEESKGLLGDYHDKFKAIPSSGLRPGDFKSFWWKNAWSILAMFGLMVVPVTLSLISITSLKVSGLAFKHYADTFVPKNGVEKEAETLRKIYKKADEWRITKEGTIGKDSFNNTFLVGVNASRVRKVYQVLKKHFADRMFEWDMQMLSKLLYRDPAQVNSSLYQFQDASIGLKIPLEELIHAPGQTAEEKMQNHQHLNTILQSSIDPVANLAGNGRCKVIIYIEHFGLTFDDNKLNKAKLYILQQLVNNPLIRVVISSSISPIKIYEHYEDQIRQLSASLGADKDKESNISLLEGIKRDYRMWLSLLGSFYRVNVPFDASDLDWKEKDKLNPISKVMAHEFNHGKYLQQLYFYKKSYLKCKNEEDVILHVQETSYTYFFSIWNNLSKEEHYIIYDIARDKLVNTNNVDGILDLLHKGILVFDHSLRLMNDSFGNFVLSKVNSDEALARELESKQMGNWNITSAVLLLVALSLLVFISFGRLNILNQLNTAVVSVSAAMTLLLRIGGLFAFTKAVKG